MQSRNTSGSLILIPYAYREDSCTKQLKLREPDRRISSGATLREESSLKGMFQLDHTM